MDAVTTESVVLSDVVRTLEPMYQLKEKKMHQIYSFKRRTLVEAKYKIIVTRRRINS